LQLTRDLHQCYPLLVKMHSTKSHCAIVACVEFRTHVYMQQEGVLELITTKAGTEIRAVRH
jgi:hypothetical protein